MNKKHVNIILSILLALIWGSVIYKYFGKSKIKNYEQPKVLYSENYSYKEIKDTFNLELSNRDPFKVTKLKASTGFKKSITNNKQKKANPKSEIWPKVEYFGYVKKDKNQTKLAIIKVNNKLFRKREKENIEEIYIVKAYSDSLIIKFNSVQKTIKK